MKILSAEQTRAADKYTIANEPISSLDLMERASRQLYLWFHENLNQKPPVAIYCGKGNNGGDGLALARMLLLTGWKIKVFIIEHSSNRSQDFEQNLDRLSSLKADIFYVDAVDALKKNHEKEVIVDAILGSGLNAPLRGLIAEIIQELNRRSNRKVAIDIPTGLFTDNNGQNDLEKILKADVTLTFQTPSLSFMFPETGERVGHFEVLDIGLHEDYLNQVDSNYAYFTSKEVSEIFKHRAKFAHKGTNGHAAIVGGSLGKYGACLLASRSCIKSGAGLVTSIVPNSGIPVLQIGAPEVMVSFAEGEHVITGLSLDQKWTYGFGPGMGSDASTSACLIKSLEELSSPVVLDADALNILSEENAWHVVPKYSVLTPHIGELSRMVGKQENVRAYLDAALKFAQKNELNIVMKGAHSAVISSKGQVSFNSTGNPGMATAGSGDVLTGSITALLAQGYSPFQSAQLGVFFHGLAGDLAKHQIGVSGLTAIDILDHIPAAIKSFEA